MITRQRRAPPLLVAAALLDARPPAAARRGGSQRGGPRRPELQQPQLPPQNLVLLAAAGDLQLQHRVAAVHQLADLRHRRVGQNLHDGGELGVKGGGGRHFTRRATRTSTETPLTRLRPARQGRKTKLSAHARSHMIKREAFLWNAVLVIYFFF